MDIGNTHGIGGAGRIEGPQKPQRALPPAYTQAAGRTDKVDISERAHIASEVLGLPDVRMERVEQVRRLIESGRFDTMDRLQGALDRFVAEEGQPLP